MPIAKLIESVKEKLDDPSFTEVGKWKKEHPGKAAIGYFPVYAPVEIIHAAGMLPVLVSGALGRIGLDEADGYLQAFVCSIGRSTLELKIDGYLDNLDVMVFPSICEISRSLYGIWKRRFPETKAFFINYL